MNESRKLRSLILIVLAGVSWSFAGVLGKFITWNAISIAGFRSVVSVLLLGAARKSFIPTNTKWNWIGGIGVISTSILFMLANKMTSSANAIVIQYAMTAIVILAQILLMHKKALLSDIIAAISVMLGVVLCFYQGMGEGRLAGNLIALASAFTWALVFLSARMPNVDAMSYTYQGSLLGCLLMVYLPFDKGVAAGGLQGWIVALAMGICLGMGFLLFSKGMQGGVSPSAAAIVSNVEPVLNPVWTFIFLAEFPGMFSVIGALIVLGTVTVYSLRGSRKQAKNT